MNVHSSSRHLIQMATAKPDLPSDRRGQILQAAMACFAKKGFHQTSMHDLSAEAGISVGLIYRYFESKDAVISAMAEEHKKDIQSLLERARTAPTLLDSLEILLTAHCCEEAPQMHAAFVMDLFAEASRNPRIADLVRDVIETGMEGVTEVIARSPQFREASHGLEAHEVTELIFAAARGSMMRDVLERDNIPNTQRRERQLRVVRNLWRLLFSKEADPAYA
ncbi:MAG TPA: TetR/AcrR family transcriptional regulator [Chthoniobacterales bacterium]|nr:TetR/AcrR family transcriptional regulator [Chthoniobacterales bacterium]